MQKRTCRISAWRILFHYLMIFYSCEELIIFWCNSVNLAQKKIHSTALVAICTLPTLFHSQFLQPAFTSHDAPAWFHLTHPAPFRAQGRLTGEFFSWRKLGGRNAKIAITKACISIYLLFKITVPCSRGENFSRLY